VALIYLLAFFLVYKKALHTLGGLWVEKLEITCTPDRVLLLSLSRIETLPSMSYNNFSCIIVVFSDVDGNR